MGSNKGMGIMTMVVQNFEAMRPLTQAEIQQVSGAYTYETAFSLAMNYESWYGYDFIGYTDYWPSQYWELFDFDGGGFGSGQWAIYLDNVPEGPLRIGLAYIPE